MCSVTAQRHASEDGSSVSGEGPPALTPLEASRVLDVSEESIRRWIRQRKLTATIVGARYRVQPADLEQVVRRIASESGGE